MDNKVKKQQIKRLFDYSFPENKAWNDWFFDEVYADDEAMLLYDEEKPVSSLFLQKYKFLFHGEEVDLGYIAGANTDRKQRGRGFMSTLLKDAMKESYRRGDTFLGIIPANRRLYFFYDKFGFATVVYNDIERYTSLHSFPLSEGLKGVKPTYESFHKLEKMRCPTVLHSETDFRRILEDIKLDNGAVIEVDDPEGEPLAMVFGIPASDEIHVKTILGNNHEAIDMALGLLKAELNVELPIFARRAPGVRQQMLRAFGMLRIINVEKTLDALAKNHKDIAQLIRVTDPIISENNGLFRIRNGKCVKTDEANEKATIDVKIDILTAIIFSGEEMGRIFGLPTSHPQMDLMLD